MCTLAIARASAGVASRMRVEPVNDAAAVVDPVARLAASREVVVVVLVADEDRLFAEHLQRDEELLGLLDGAAEVALGVKDEQRRPQVLDIGERRAVADLL